MKLLSLLARPLLRYGLIGLLLTGTLVTLVTRHGLLLANGRPVDFMVEPVDPRSLFRGDYVILTYAFSRLEEELPPGAELPLRDGETLFVTLENNASVSDPPDWQIAAYGKTPPVRTGRQVLLRATVDTVYGTSRPQPTPRPAPESEGTSDEENSSTPAPEAFRMIALLDYGLESYFVEEGTGLEIERARNQDRVMVHVRVDDKGRSGIAGLSLLEAPEGETLSDRADEASPRLQTAAPAAGEPVEDQDTNNATEPAPQREPLVSDPATPRP